MPRHPSRPGSPRTGWPCFIGVVASLYGLAQHAAGQANNAAIFIITRVAFLVVGYLGRGL